jgi:hypothetical protein
VAAGVISRDKLQSGHADVFVGLIYVFEVERMLQGLAWDVDDGSWVGRVVVGLISSPCQLCGVVDVFPTSGVASALSSHKWPRADAHAWYVLRPFSLGPVIKG